jgi:hypothetical protein
MQDLGRLSWETDGFRSRKETSVALSPRVREGRAPRGRSLRLQQTLVIRAEPIKDRSQGRPEDGLNIDYMAKRVQSREQLALNETALPP